jgi:hypothetical protein
MAKREQSKTTRRVAVRNVCYDERNFKAAVRFLYYRNALRAELGEEVVPCAMPEVEVELHSMISAMVADPHLHVVSMREGVDLVRESFEGGTLTVYFMVNPLAGEALNIPAEFWHAAPDVAKLGRMAHMANGASV